jgi:phenylalanyl-tRNA synthetase beta chain
MKLTLSWLKEHLETDASLDEISAALTMLGLEVETITDRSAELAPFTVAYVEAAEQHPNADRLRVCKVNTGTEVLDVVCGAPNARAGMKGVFAPIGTRIPGTDMVLEKRAIRGVTGFGMLCSEREMGISDDHEGIIELPEDAEVGAPFAPLVGLDDPLIDIAITPDRADCLGVLGIARDLAAAGLGKLITPVTEPLPGAFISPIVARLDFATETAEPCPLFVGRYIRGVKNGPSPDWLQRRLRAVGLRPISALVDITNLATLDRARPLHVFDADALAGNIHVRLARAGESLAALDDKTYALDPEMCVIADDDGPVALAGVIGGVPTSCTAETTNVFVESAYFDPVRTATTGRKLQIESDARYRFERGVDREGTAPGAQYATHLILDICGGEASELVITGGVPLDPREIIFRPGRVHALGGLDVQRDESVAILRALGFAPQTGAEDITVSVPTWRHDIDGEADIVEEVLRVKGFDAIPAVSLPRDHAVAVPGLDGPKRRARQARRALAARGLNECVTWSFLSGEQAALFGGGKPELALANPISSELTDMRPSTLPNLLAAVARNRARGFDDFGLFEIGPVYADDTPEGQGLVAGGLRRGQSGPRNWLNGPRPVDAFDAKGDAMALLAALGAPADRASVTADAPEWYHPGRSGVLRLGPKTVLGHFGELHPRILAAFDAEAPIAAFELFLDALPQPKPKATRARPPFAVSDLPAVSRDFAFLVDEGVSAEDVLRAVRQVSAKNPLKLPFADITLFDIYEGKGMAEGKKSVAFSITLQPSQHTLTDEDIKTVEDAVVAQVTKVTGGELRG